MAFFSDGQNRLKLYLLFALKCFRTPVTREQLFAVLGAVDPADYFSVCSLAGELEEEQYLISVPVKERQLLYLTEKGEKLVSAFGAEIARSVRDEIVGLTDEARESVRRENCITAEAQPRPDGTWELTLALIDGEGELFSMTLRMPDAPSASNARRKWLAEAGNIYAGLFMELAE